MTWIKQEASERNGAHKAALAIGACAVAGVAMIRLTRALSKWRAEHLTFDFPIEEELFIGWGGGNVQ